MRTLTTTLLACAWTVVTTTAAFAQGQSYPPPGAQASVAGTGDGTAFTGTDLTAPVTATAVLLLIGTTVLIVARRRARMLQGRF